MASDGRAAERGVAGLAGAAVKPAEHDLGRAGDLRVPRVVVDYEGREHVPDADALAALARERAVRVTVPVRADGFDPLGDDSLVGALPDGVGRVAVAGHPAYLSDAERRRPVAPRLRAAVDADPDTWVGTEGVERAALATGATQFELLSRSTDRDLRALRDAGFEGRVAVYAPVVFGEDEDAVLDALGAYAARREPVAAALPEGAPADATATGRAREVLVAACKDYALCGPRAAVREQVARLHEAGADAIVGYPARGLDALL